MLSALRELVYESLQGSGLVALAATVVMGAVALPVALGLVGQDDVLWSRVGLWLLAGGFVGFVLFFIFVSPIKLWRKEKRRALGTEAVVSRLSNELEELRRKPRELSPSETWLQTAFSQQAALIDKLIRLAEAPGRVPIDDERQLVSERVPSGQVHVYVEAQPATARAQAFDATVVTESAYVEKSPGAPGSAPILTFRTGGRRNRRVPISRPVDALRFPEADLTVHPDDLPKLISYGDGYIVIKGFLSDGFIIDEVDTAGDRVDVELIYSDESSNAAISPQDQT